MEKVRTPAISLAIVVVAFFIIVSIVFGVIGRNVTFAMFWAIFGIFNSTSVILAFYKNYNIITREKIVIVKNWQKIYKKWEDVESAVRISRPGIFSIYTRIYPKAIISFKDDKECFVVCQGRAINIIKGKGLLVE